MQQSNFEREHYMNLFRDIYSQGERIRLKMYTDGNSHPHKEPHQGGWAFVVLYSPCDREVEADDVVGWGFGGELNTTNNLMETRAVVEGMKWLPDHCDVEIVTDSKLCVGLFGGEYDNGKFSAQYMTFNELKRRKDINVSFSWVKGHAEDRFNNYVDKLTNAGDAEALLMYNQPGV